MRIYTQLIFYLLGGRRRSAGSSLNLVDSQKSPHLPTVHRSGMTARKSMRTRSSASAVNSCSTRATEVDQLDVVDSSFLPVVSLRNAKQSKETPADLSESLPDDVCTDGDYSRWPSRRNTAGKIAHRPVTRGPAGKNSPKEASDAKQAITDLKNKRTRNIPTKGFSKTR